MLLAGIQDSSLGCIPIEMLAPRVENKDERNAKKGLALRFQMPGEKVPDGRAVTERQVVTNVIAAFE
jgi:hypothetical protein